MESPAAYKSRPSINAVPAEILTKIASLLTPTLSRCWLPVKGQQHEGWRKQHSIITAVQRTNTRFADACRPFVHRTVCFQADEEAKAPQKLLEAVELQHYVRELRWEVEGDEAAGVAPFLIQALSNLTSLVFSPPWYGNNSPPLLGEQYTIALNLAENLQELHLEGFAGLEKPSIAEEDFPNSSNLTNISISSWWADKNGSLAPRADNLVYITERPKAGAGEARKAVVKQLPLHKKLTLIWVPRYSPENELNRTMSVEHLEELGEETIQGLPLEEFEATGYLITNSTGVVPVLALLSACESLRTLTFTDSRCGPAGVRTPWQTLSMPFVKSLTLHMSLGTASDPASLRAIINAFSTLVHLDIANVLPAPVLFHSSSASPVEHLHAETRQFLQWISEQTTIETFIVRYPMKKEILRFKREGDLEEEAESSLFGFSCELWHEW